MVELIRLLQADGVLIDQVGFQAHFNAIHPPDPESVRANIRRFGELGVTVNFSEMDVRIADLRGTQEENLWVQARIGFDIAHVCATEPACDSVTWWGFTDR